MGCAGSKKAPQVGTTCGVAWLCRVDRNCTQIVHAFRLCISKAWPESGSSNEWSCGWAAIHCCLLYCSRSQGQTQARASAMTWTLPMRRMCRTSNRKKQAADGRQAQSRVDASSASEHRAWPLPLCILSKHPLCDTGTCRSARLPSSTLWPLTAGQVRNHGRGERLLQQRVKFCAQ